jgi:hypothetical protein
VCVCVKCERAEVKERKAEAEQHLNVAGHHSTHCNLRLQKSVLTKQIGQHTVTVDTV